MYFTGVLKLIIAVVITLSCQLSYAANLHVKVLDSNQNPVEYAVVYINESLVNLSDDTLVIDQVDKEFIPYVTAIRRGSAINFPNNDEIRHQVYSFSKAKQFELPLYTGNPSRPVVFDKNGAVALACNIHDWMKAYVYVVDTDKFVLTDASGHGVLPNLPAGQYEVLVWHPKLGGTVQSTAKQIMLQGEKQELVFSIAQKTQFKAWRAPKSLNRRGYQGGFSSLCK